MDSAQCTSARTLFTKINHEQISYRKPTFGPQPLGGQAHIWTTAACAAPASSTASSSASGVSVWYEQHSTKNRLGIKPGPMASILTHN